MGELSSVLDVPGRMTAKRVGHIGHIGHMGRSPMGQRDTWRAAKPQVLSFVRFAYWSSKFGVGS